MSRMSQRMVDTLRLSSGRDGIRRVHKPGPGQPPWPAHPLTLHALIGRGLVEVRETRNSKDYRVTVWTITDAGREALSPAPRVVRDATRRLRVAGGTTLIPAGGGWEERRIAEPEPVSHAELKVLPTTFEARQRHQAAVLGLEQAREAMPIGELVMREIAAAQLAGIDTRVYEESILRRVRALRNRTRRAA